MEFSIKFSYVNLIQGSIHWPTLRALSYNIYSDAGVITFICKEQWYTSSSTKYIVICKFCE